MDHIEYPSRGTWDVRRKWFDDMFDIDRRGGGYELGEHATGLLVDLQAVFCVGAFVSVVVISCAVIDSHLNEVELDSKRSPGMRETFKASSHSLELEWLRTRRSSRVLRRYHCFCRWVTVPTRRLSKAVDITLRWQRNASCSKQTRHTRSARERAANSDKATP